jgi:Fe-S-cluster containining protein
MAPPVKTERLQQAIEHDFQCQRCGNCCKGDGLVHFGAREAQRMADALKITRASFLRRYAINVERGQWVLKDRGVQISPNVRELWCIFLRRDPDGLYACDINRAKPDQCREFPAKWRNPDSLRSCAGLRLLMRGLREADKTVESA